MKIRLIVELDVEKIEPQPTKEFREEDGRAMIRYTSERIKETLMGSWQYNAQVRKVKVKEFK